MEFRRRLQQFVDNMELMKEYLSSDNREPTMPNSIVIIRNILINFTISYGAKSILSVYNIKKMKKNSR